MIKGIDNSDRIVVTLNNSSKSDDRSHLSKLFVDSLVQHISAFCTHIVHINLRKEFHMNGCFNVYEIYYFSK